MQGKFISADELEVYDGFWKSGKRSHGYGK